jgi:IS30 family transposase
MRKLRKHLMMPFTFHIYTLPGKHNECYTRGTNKNTNVLFSPCIQKGKSFNNLPTKYMRFIEIRLNFRPIKFSDFDISMIFLIITSTLNT